MNLKDLEALAKALAPALEAKVTAIVEKRMAGLEEQLKQLVAALPTPQDGKDADPEVMRQMVNEAVAELPTPQDGKDADPDVIKEMVDAAVARIPTPQDGKDADPDVIKEMVDAAVAALPILNGKDGEDGKDADPDVIKEMVENAVAALPILNGKDGEDGKDADPDVIKELVDAAVAELPAPQDGKDADPDVIKEMVENAVAELPEPENGKDGAPGRDAIDLDIMPSIDFKRSYPRGVYAIHKGGLWRSHSTTDAERGWECLVSGVEGLEVRQVDGRNYELVVNKSTGSESFPVAVPAMIYRGVYRQGDDYEQGDAVTWAGSLWHCDEPTGDKPGEPRSKGWTLAVKRGRDGKNGEKGKQGEKGDTGRPGKDLTQLRPDGSKY